MGHHIAKARAGLILDQPFFASLLLPMPMTESEEVPTFATDGTSIVFNPKWAETLTLAETTFVLAHEVLHCVFDHMGRRGDKVHSRWNQAADYVINGILTKERIGTMPKGGLLDSALVAKGNGTAEGVYRLLDGSNDGKGPGQKGGSLDDVLDAGSDMGQGPADPAAAAQASAELKVRVIQAKNAAKMAGKMPASIERLVNDLVKPAVDWRDVLRRFISDRARVEYTFARPKRRFLAEDMYLPSLGGQRMGLISIGVDCSGSVDAALLNAFAAEINAIREDVLPSRIEVFYFDSRVVKVETFEADDTVKLSPVGGGGTAFSPVFEAINGESEMPAACVMLTDLYCDDFGPPPHYPVLWAVKGGPAVLKAPFGETIRIESEET